MVKLRANGMKSGQLTLTFNRVFITFLFNFYNNYD